MEIGIEQYMREQVEVWASYADELEEIRHRLADGITLVVEAGNQPVGFGQLNPVSHVSFFYTSKDYPRMGVAGAIYKQLEEFAAAQNVSKLDTRASRISRSFLEKMGFQLVSAVTDTRNSIEIECTIAVGFGSILIKSPVSFYNRNSNIQGGVNGQSSASGLGNVSVHSWFNHFLRAESVPSTKLI